MTTYQTEIDEHSYDEIDEFIETLLRAYDLAEPKELVEYEPA